MRTPAELMRLQLAALARAERDHFKTQFQLFKEHRDDCGVCGSSNPLCGPHCETGRQLRNNAIDEMHA